MMEEQAEAVAAALGGQTWQSGGEMWLVIFRRLDGSIMVLSDETVNEYASEDDMELGTPKNCIMLH